MTLRHARPTRRLTGFAHEAMPMTRKKRFHHAHPGFVVRQIHCEGVAAQLPGV